MNHTDADLQIKGAVTVAIHQSRNCDRLLQQDEITLDEHKEARHESLKALAATARAIGQQEDRTPAAVTTRRINDNATELICEGCGRFESACDCH